jgi:hypothetical protein
MRWNCAFSVLVLGCYGDDKDGLPEQPTGSGFLVEEVLTSCPGPSARRFHLATVFVHEPTLLYTLTAPTRRAERGLVIFGGEALDGTPLDDLWLFDLSRPWDSCPWVRLASDKSNFAGSLTASWCSTEISSGSWAPELTMGTAGRRSRAHYPSG